MKLISFTYNELSKNLDINKSDLFELSFFVDRAILYFKKYFWS